MRHVSRWSGLSLAGVLLIGCDREPAARAPAESTPGSANTSGDSIGPADVRTGWEPSLGPLLLVANAQHDASAIFPDFSDSTLTDTTTFDTSVLRDLRVDLFSRAGLVGRGELQSAPARRQEDGCVAWPEATVRVTDSLQAGSAWTVAFAAGRGTPIPLDSLETQTGADSARLTADVSRLASLVPNDTAATFRGIPYFVRQARRFRIAPSTEVLIANVMRRINQEANPREEQLFLIAERDVSNAASRHVLVYHERVSGLEEAIESTDVLAAVTLGPAGAPALVLIRDYGDGSAYAMLTRAADGGWHLAWNSAYAGC
jgi:hypothetical protein